MACNIEKDFINSLIDAYITANGIKSKDVVSLALQVMEDFQVSQFTEKLLIFVEKRGCEDE